MKLKSFLSLATLIVTGANSHAQSNWSFGFRTGAEVSKTQTLNEQTEGLLFHEQLFVTKRIFKHLEVELNTAFKGGIKNATSIIGTNDGPDVSMQTSSSNIIELGLTLRYFFFNHNGWNTYTLAGLNASRTTTNSSSYNSAFTGWGGYFPDSYKNEKYRNYDYPNELYIGIGVNKSLTDKWKVNSQLLLSYANASQSMSQSYYIMEEFSPKLQLGFAYCW